MIKVNKTKSKNVSNTSRKLFQPSQSHSHGQLPCSCCCDKPCDYNLHSSLLSHDTLGIPMKEVRVDGLLQDSPPVLELVEHQ